MLHEFLIENKKAILARAADDMLEHGVGPPPEVLRGIPIFFDQLIEVLRQKEGPAENMGNLPAESKTDMATSAAKHGDELLRLGFTISQVIHGYGSICQGVTSLANEMNVGISTGAFQVLNKALDHAISEAVTQFQLARTQISEKKEAEHLGFLAHELRNTLTSALASFQMIQKGAVGVGGSTGKVLGQSLIRMRDLIDRSLTDVRLKSGAEPHWELVRLTDLVDQVTAVSLVEAESKGIRLNIEIPPDLWVRADPHLLLSAMSNLSQNAIKFTRAGGNVWLRGFASDGRVVFEVEDECGGLPSAKTDSFLKPFVQGSSDRRGLGLGLTIAQRAVQASEGEFQFRNIPGKGCIFGVSLKQAMPASGPAAPSAA